MDITETVIKSEVEIKVEPCNCSAEGGLNYELFTVQTYSIFPFCHTSLDILSADPEFNGGGEIKTEEVEIKLEPCECEGGFQLHIFRKLSALLYYLVVGLIQES